MHTGVSACFGVFEPRPACLGEDYRWNVLEASLDTRLEVTAHTGEDAPRST